MPSLNGTACCFYCMLTVTLFFRHRLKETVPGGATFPRLLLHHPWRHGFQVEDAPVPRLLLVRDEDEVPLWEVAWRPSQSMEPFGWG